MTLQQKIWKGAGVFWNSLVPLLLYILIPSLFGVIGMAIRSFSGDTAAFVLQSGNFYRILGSAAYLYVLWHSAKKRGTTIFEDTTLIYQGADRELCILYLGFGFMSALTLSAILTVVPLPGFLLHSYVNSADAIFQGTDLVLAVVNILVLAPVIEEIIFRGYMLNRCLRFFEEKKAVYITSAVFALCHVEIIWMLYAFVIGLILGRTSIRKDNIFYGIILHGGFNLFSVVNLIILQSSRIQSVFFANKLLAALYGVVGGISLLLIIRKLESREDWYL